VPFVDAHTHTWGPNVAELPWLADDLPSGWEGAYTHADLLTDMDAYGVDEAVVVTPPLYGRGPRANEYTMRSIEAHPNRLWGVGLLDVFADRETVRADVRRVTGHGRILGIRMHPALAYGTPPGPVDRTANWIADDRLEPAWEAAAAADAIVFLLAKAPQLPAIDAIALEHPGVRIVVDHMAWPDEETAPDERPWTAFEDLAERENVAVKVSSLPRSATDEWPYESLYPYVRRLVDWFGSDRLLLGSDYP